MGPIPEPVDGKSDVLGANGLTGVSGDPVALPVVWRQPVATVIKTIDETAMRHERIMLNPITGGKKLSCHEL